MILRNKKINVKSDAIQVNVGFGIPDVKAWMQTYARKMADSVNETFAKTTVLSEQDVRYCFEHSGEVFLSWPEKWREELSAWAFNVAVREKFLKPSATNENQYYLAESLFVRRGRPKSED